MVYTLDMLGANVEQESMEVIMARALAEKTTEEQLQSQVTPYAAQDESTCVRCGGLMVNDFCMDLLNSFGESKFFAKRCVQCGEVVDLVILQNRRTRQVSMTVQLQGERCQTIV
jgi:hypothetical protein